MDADEESTRVTNNPREGNDDWANEVISSSSLCVWLECTEVITTSPSPLSPSSSCSSSSFPSSSSSSSQRHPVVLKKKKSLLQKKLEEAGVTRDRQQGGNSSIQHSVVFPSICVFSSWHLPEVLIRKSARCQERKTRERGSARWRKQKPSFAEVRPVYRNLSLWAVRLVLLKASTLRAPSYLQMSSVKTSLTFHVRITHRYSPQHSGAAQDGAAWDSRQRGRRKLRSICTW